MKRLLLFFTICLLLPFSVYSLEYPSVNSKVVEVYDLDDKTVLYEIDSKNKASIASLTKIATTITAIESIKDLDEKVTITDKILKTVSWDASVAGLKAGDKVTYRDLLYASMLPSGADATNSIAILSSGSIDNFVKKINDLAVKLKLENTHFENVTGLDDDNHYSSADDVRKLLEYSLKNKTFKKIYTTKKYTMSNGKTVKSTLYKYSNSGMDTTPILGSKTGYTGDAGYCLASLTNINGHDMLVILLKADKSSNTYYNIKDTLSLVEFMNNNYKDEVIIKKGQEVKKIPVKLSKIDTYTVYADKDVERYLPSDYDKNKIKIKYDGLEELTFLNRKGSTIGTLKYYYNNELLAKQKVTLDKDIDASIGKILKKYYYVIIIILLLIFILRKRKKKRKKTKRRR